MEAISDTNAICRVIVVIIDACVLIFPSFPRSLRMTTFCLRTIVYINLKFKDSNEIRKKEMKYMPEKN